jgi:quercetin dioxygenase-like cupin family protein
MKDKTNSEHYTWGNACDGWYLLKSDSLSVIEERMPPGTSEARHYHEKTQQLFYMLSGTAVMEIEGVEHTLVAGQSIHIQAGQKHRISNRTIADLHFLVISEPKSHGDRVNC